MSTETITIAEAMVAACETNYCRVDDLQLNLLIPPDVMSPSPYSKLVARFLLSEPLTGKSVLDMGTGSGILSIVAALCGAREVWATDVCPRAVQTAALNIAYYHLESRIKVLCGDLFGPVAGQKFDMIVCNPPSLPMKNADGAASLSYVSGEDGRKIIDSLITESRRFLAPRGILAFVNTSLADLERTKLMLHDSVYDVSIPIWERVRFRPFYFEHLDWLRVLAGEGKAIYESDGSTYYETLYMIRALAVG